MAETGWAPQNSSRNTIKEDCIRQNPMQDISPFANTAQDVYHKEQPFEGFIAAENQKQTIWHRECHRRHPCECDVGSEFYSQPHLWLQGSESKVNIRNSAPNGVERVDRHIQLQSVSGEFHARVVVAEHEQQGAS
jgi:hypothetical protein